MELKIKLKWLYGFFTQTVYEHLLPVNYIVSKEGISGYSFNRNLFKIIKSRIIYYPRMDRGWDGEFILMDGCSLCGFWKSEKWCEYQKPDSTWKEMVFLKSVNNSSHCTWELFFRRGVMRYLPNIA